MYNQKVIDIVRACIKKVQSFFADQIYFVTS